MATLATRLMTWLRGELVGSDSYGNRYYRGRRRAGHYTERRWVIYHGADEASSVPSEWHGWLHHISDDVPPDDALRHVLKQMDPEVALLALIGANQAVVDRVMTQFPAPLANHLQRQLTEIAPTHLRDVELARKEMVVRAAHVAETAV